MGADDPVGCGEGIGTADAGLDVDGIEMVGAIPVVIGMTYSQGIAKPGLPPLPFPPRFKLPQEPFSARKV